MTQIDTLEPTPTPTLGQADQLVSAPLSEPGLAPSRADQLDWTSEDAAAAAAEGWQLVTNDAGGRQLTIERIAATDLLADTAAAVAFVFGAAVAGGQLHQRAIRLAIATAPNYLPPKVGINMDGGICQGHWSSEAVDVYTVDYDDNGSDDDGIVSVEQDDGSCYDAYVSKTRVVARSPACFARLDKALAEVEA